MTIIICSGPLFTDWKDLHDQILLTDSVGHGTYEELSELNTKICKEQMPEADLVGWKPFSTDGAYDQEATQLLECVSAEPLLTWADPNSSLILNFWCKASEETRFILFYSSPEYALSHYIRKHTFDASAIKSAIEAWTVRTRAMLTVFLVNRNRCLLLDVQSAMTNTDKLVRAINEAFSTAIAEPNQKGYQSPKESVLHEYLAATLLANDALASELYDEIRSTATRLDDDRLVLRDIQTRTELLIPDFLWRSNQQEQVEKDLNKTTDDLNMMELQLHQTQNELEFYYFKERDTAALNEKYVEFLNQNPVLKLARLARLNEPSE